MPRTLRTPRHEALRRLLISERKAAGLTQVEVAARLSQSQSWVAKIEGGERRVDVVELMELAEAIGFDATEAVRIVRMARAG